MVITEFNDIEISLDQDFKNGPVASVYYKDDDVLGAINIITGEIEGNFSKYVLPVIKAWYEEFKKSLKEIWETRVLYRLPDWED